jgi:bifunctional pyridoxal-dependent enzyme with beta-cystathionase and maltose regulon repressor activities
MQNRTGLDGLHPEPPQRAKVATVRGVAFGKLGEGHIRLSFANSTDNIKEALRRMADYCPKSSPKKATAK